jgi:hypothetical protein
MTEVPTKFILPEQINNLKRNGDPKSSNTINLYKAHLNMITKATGFTTIEQFMKATRKVNSAIKILAEKKPDEPVAKHLSRVRIFYSAIFMVLPKKYMEKPNPFYRANKKYQDGNPADFKKTTEEKSSTDDEK